MISPQASYNHWQRSSLPFDDESRGAHADTEADDDDANADPEPAISPEMFPRCELTDMHEANYARELEVNHQGTQDQVESHAGNPAGPKSFRQKYMEYHLREAKKGLVIHTDAVASCSANHAGASKRCWKVFGCKPKLGDVDAAVAGTDIDKKNISKAKRSSAANATESASSAMDQEFEAALNVNSAWPNLMLKRKRPQAAASASASDVLEDAIMPLCSGDETAASPERDYNLALKAYEHFNVLPSGSATIEQVAATSAGVKGFFRYGRDRLSSNIEVQQADVNADEEEAETSAVGTLGMSQQDAFEASVDGSKTGRPRQFPSHASRRTRDVRIAIPLGCGTGKLCCFVA